VDNLDISYVNLKFVYVENEDVINAAISKHYGTEVRLEKTDITKRSVIG